MAAISQDRFPTCRFTFTPLPFQGFSIDEEIQLRPYAQLPQISLPAPFPKGEGR
jgi:hypothetical protein